MIRRLFALLSLLVLGTVLPAFGAPLKLGVLPAADTIVLHVAADEGLFAEQGLEVELIPFQSALELGAAMRAGALDGHFGDIINVLMQNESGSPQAIVATTSHSSPEGRCFGLVVSPKSEAQTLSDLKGKDIAVSSATIIDFLLTELLQKEEVAPDFLNRQDIRQIPVRLQMLLSGQIESALLPEPLVSLVEAKGARTILDDRKLNTPLAVIALKRTVLDAPDGADTVAKFRKALTEAAARINGKPDTYRPVMEAKGLLPKGASAQYAMVRFDRAAFRGGHQGLRGLDEGQPHPQERPGLRRRGFPVSNDGRRDAGIAVRDLSKGYGEGPVLDGLSFDLPDGETLSVIGPSGCGKSTLLYLLAGLDKPDRGTVRTGDVGRRDNGRISFILQDYGLFPWKTVRENLALPLELQGLSSDRRREAVAAMLEELGLAGLGERYPAQLSGGQRQRIAIGRALITDPDILLMDEPFSSLDALTREHLQTTVLSLWQRRRPTCVLVTHNVPEAVFLGKHVMVMNGRPARNVMWLENPCFGDAEARGEDRYFTLTKRVYAALSGTEE